MSVINFHAKEIAVKLVYYGPGLGGKTTSLQWIYQHLPPEKRPQMVSLATEVDRTIFFDFMPVVAYKIRDYLVRLQLYTVPGQVFYNATRKLVLNGVDGIIFVADSQTAMQDANGESLQNLQDNLLEIGIDPVAIPLVLQYNKRDLQDIDTIVTMDSLYNPRALPAFATIATSGVGLMDALRTVSQAVIQKLKDQGLGTPERVEPTTTRKSPKDGPKSTASSPKTEPLQSAPSNPNTAPLASHSFSASFAASQADKPQTRSSLPQEEPHGAEDFGQMQRSTSAHPAIPKEQIHAIAQEMGLLHSSNEPRVPTTPPAANPMVQVNLSYQGKVDLFPPAVSLATKALQDALFAGQFVQVLQQTQMVMDELVGHGDGDTIGRYLWEKGIPLSKWQRIQQHVALAQASPQLITQTHAMQALALILECTWS